MNNRTLKVAFALLVAFLLAGAPALEAGNKNVRSSSKSSVGNKNVNRNNNSNRNTNINSNKNVNVNSNRNNNVNINRDRDIDIDVDVDHRGGCCYNNHHHGVGVVGAVAAVAVTAAVVGSIVNTLPPSCSVVMVNGFTYQQCGSVWYQPQFVGTTTSYVVVTAPR